MQHVQIAGALRPWGIDPAYVRMLKIERVY